jgi:hypothetical protein
MNKYPTVDLPCDKSPFWDSIVDDQETVLQSSHREWVEDQELEWQRRDKLVVERFLAQKLKQKR